jgi:4-hydroxy-tetrahydrodipicolinate synthase
MSPAIQGIFVPNVAPYRADGSLHEDELRRIVSWLIDKSVSGLYPNGSMGEFIRLSYEERRRVVEIVAEETAGRVPILAGAAEPNTDLVLEMCHHCADLGCRAVSITGPYYYKPSQESIEAYFRDLAARSPIDIVIYNIPAFAAEISVPVLTRLALDCPRIIGTKDSSADMCRFLHVMNAIKPQRPEFSVLVGWEELMVPTLMMGGDGGTLSTAGVAPEAIMKIYHEARSGHWEEARRLQYKLLELFQTMLSAANFPTGFRLGYEVRGFDVGRARYPNAPEEEAGLAEIRARIACLLGECGFDDLATQCRLPGFRPEPSLGGTTPPATGSAPHASVDTIVREVMRTLRPGDRS